MTTISATSILASQIKGLTKPDGSPYRIDTLLLRYPRCIHAEFMTHRVFSRNASSSRAIPVAKLIHGVQEDPYVPIHWGANQKGMQADQECSELIRLGGGAAVDRECAWHEAMWRAIEIAKAFDKAGYHKQIINRLLEPFSHITVVVTATEWANFFALRDHPAAEPHIRMLARQIRKAMTTAPIQMLEPGQWHLPFVSNEEKAEIWDYGRAVSLDDLYKRMVKLSAARCASTSYKTVEGFDMTMERAALLHDKLVGEIPMHASPMEHQAQADDLIDYYEQMSKTSRKVWTHQEQHRNFVGFRQYRAMIPGESVPS